MNHHMRFIMLLMLHTALLYSTATLDRLRHEVFKDPYKIERHEHLIKVLINEELFDEAQECIKHALKLFNQPISILMLQANLYLQQKKVEHAASLYLELHKKIPNNKFILHNIGWSLSLMRKHAHAIPYYLKSLKIDPEYDYSHLGIAKAYIAIGEYEKAWPHFERRMANFRTYKSHTDVSKMRIEDFIGKRVLIRAEWGLGDMMHFLRFAKELKKIGAREVIVQTFEPLVPLFSMCDYIDHVFCSGQVPPPFDIQIPMMSLTYLFNTTLNTIPQDFPYLHADPYLIEEWRPFFEKDTTIKIGLCWGAKKIFLEDHPYTRRSIPLKQFAMLADIPNVSFYSLQKVYDTDQLDQLPAHFKVHDFGPDFDEANGRFMDTAAVMNHLDIIVSVDTSIIHLAGNLAKTPVWVLLPYNAAWWWLYDRSDSPWYPTMRFFRQPKPHDWDSAFIQLKNALKLFVQEKTTQKTHKG